MSQQVRTLKEANVVRVALLITGVIFLTLGLTGVGSAHVPEGDGWSSGTLCEGQPDGESKGPYNTGEPPCYGADPAGTWYLKVVDGTMYVHWDIDDEFDGTVSGQFVCEGEHKGEPNVDKDDPVHPDERCKKSSDHEEIIVDGPNGESSTLESMHTWNRPYGGTATQFGIHISIDRDEGSDPTLWGGIGAAQATTTTTVTTISPTTVPNTIAAAEAARRKAGLAATGIDRNSTYMWMAAGLLLLTVAMSLKGFLRETVAERVSKIIRSSRPPADR